MKMNKLAIWIALFFCCGMVDAQSISRTEKTNVDPINIHPSDSNKMLVCILVEADPQNIAAQVLLGALGYFEELDLIDTAHFEIHLVKIAKASCGPAFFKLGRYRLSSAKVLRPSCMLVDTARINEICPGRANVLRGRSYVREPDFDSKPTSLVYIADGIGLLRLILKRHIVPTDPMLAQNWRFSLGVGRNLSLVSLLKEYSADDIVNADRQNKYSGLWSPKVSVGCAMRLYHNLWLAPRLAINKVGFNRTIISPNIYAGVDHWTRVYYQEQITTWEIGLPLMYEFGALGRGKLAGSKSNALTKSSWSLRPFISLGPVINLSPTFSALVTQTDWDGATNTDRLRRRLHRYVPWLGLEGGLGLTLIHRGHSLAVQADYHPGFRQNWVQYANAGDRELQGLQTNALFQDDDWGLSNLNFSIGYGILLYSKSPQKP
jgi:hypothetical protein